ncbi:MAG: T9SS type A sorting domain-containing protein [Breznakibacter sp.]|nr:T9SS type A sorting domain-containing protein [Breznakibacter sp.]
MKKFCLVLVAFLASTFSWAQRSPLHPLDIPEGSTDLYSILDAWTPGTPPPGTNPFDDQFYISRVRPLERIKDGDYQAEKDGDPLRKMCLWVPLDDPSSKWKALPRYSLEGDNFSMWSYVDIHGNWSAPWMRVSAGMTDVAHKNGVKVGCVYGIPWAVSVSATSTNTYGKVFWRMFQKNSPITTTTYKYSTKLVQLMKYYGIDGLGCNSEFTSNSTFMNELIAFVKECKQEAAKIGWEFQLHWYDGTNDAGQITFDRGLAAHNDAIFGNNGKVTDMLFFNYNWSQTILANSVAFANTINRSSYDLYAGFDIQGRAYKNNNWAALKNNPISIGFWGAHSQSLIHQSATDDGSSDLAIQYAYLKKQELTFSGGYRNPALTPAIRTTATLANADLETFHGLSTFLTAKSTIQQVPFVSRFNLGNGLSFRNEGLVTFNHKWHNINTQDFMPTWRWWITDANDEVTTANVNSLIKADFTFDDAWFGGTSVKLQGATSFSRVKLFKTKLTVQPDYTLSITYKVLKGTDPKAKLFVAKQGALSTYLEVTLPAAGAQGQWATHTVNASDLGLGAGDVISMLGVSVANTSADYGLLLGEIAVRNPADNFNTVTPTITKVDMLRGHYNTVDYKVYYKSKDESSGAKTYNDEVGTWYYEIFFQQKDQAEQLITATTSWAGYVVDAPLVVGGAREGRVGVRAIAPDGKQKSAIAWSSYEAIPYAPVEDVEADKPVIKPGEQFTLRFKDVMHVPANWEIKDPITGATLASANSATQVTTSIPDVGLYDLYTTTDGKTTLTRGFVQVTPLATGAVPLIYTFGSDKQKAQTAEIVRYSYTSRDGEGTVSRALRIEDPNMFMIPGAAQVGKTYSYAVWFKVYNYMHDKQGTNLINKNSIKDSWPHNNWGDLWVTIRPQWQGTQLHAANEISFNVYGWTAHDSPNENMMSTGFSVTPGVWNHLVITQDATSNQKMYFNGKLVAMNTPQASSRRENTDIFFGGGGVYKAGLNGWIDEVQVWDKVLTDAEVLEAMKGYGAAPEGLQAYYTFEEVKENSYFENKGRGGDYRGKVVRIVNSGGEATSTASYEPSNTVTNNELGYPGITGSLVIKTTPEWKLETATMVDNSTEKVLDVKYPTSGTFDATLTLTNMWASATKELVEYIVIEGVSTGIEDQEVLSMMIYPNPFVDEVNLKFSDHGTFKVEVLNVTGQSIFSTVINASVSEFVKVKVNAPKGVYLLRVTQGGKVIKTLKVIKK